MASGALDFRVLGPLEVVADGRRLPIPRGKCSALLADLLLHLGGTVPTERLTLELWGEHDPEKARSGLQVYVSQLRQLLEPEPAKPRLIITEGSGYRLRIAPEELDVKRFERLAWEARHALEAGEAATAAELAEEGLREWRGPALADFQSEKFARPHIARLEDLRLQVQEDRVEARLRLGRHEEVIGELAEYVEEQPLRERLREQLMLALYRAGRQAEALEEYRRARELLVEQLGLEPSLSLRRLEAAILRQDPTLEPGTRPSPSASRAEGSVSPVFAPQDGIETVASTVRKTVTVLVTELARNEASLDPEIVEARVTRYRNVVGATVDRYGGTIDSCVGDTVVAVFGVPSLHEDDPIRCVQAALEIAPHSIDEGVRLGAETGPVLVDLTSGGPAIAGEVFSLASGLARAATPGELLVGVGLERQLTGRIRARKVGAKRSTNGPAWRIEAVRDGGRDSQRGETPFVGRQGDRRALQRAFEAVLAHRGCRLALLVGAPGVGKSRLAEEYCRDLEDKATIAVGHCLPYGEGLAFGPIAEVVGQLAGDPPDLLSLLRETADAELIASQVSGSLGFSDNQTVGDDTFWAMRKLFEACARRRPLVLLFEDLHWAKPRFLDLVEHLVDWSRDAPILVVGAARPELFEQRPTWSAPRDAVTLAPVEPLGESEARELAAGIGAAVGMDEKTITHVVERAEGNPLFLEQMLELAGTGVSLHELDLPPTITALLSARLDGLPVNERIVLSHAAVIGRVFGPRELAPLLPEAIVPLSGATLETLIRKSLIEAHGSTFAGPDAYRFRHALIRDVAYESLSKRARSTLHECLADWIVEGHSLGSTGSDELLGHHFERAFRYAVELGDADERTGLLAIRAGERLGAAGRAAAERDAGDAEIALLNRAVEVLPRDHRLRLELLGELGEKEIVNGQLERARTHVGEAKELARSERDDVLDARLRLAEIRLRMRIDPTSLTTEEILENVDQVIGVFERADEDRQLSSAWALRAFASMIRGRARIAEEAALRAADYGRRAGAVRAEVRCIHLLNGATLLGPMPADEAYRRCVERLERTRAVRWAHGSTELLLSLLSAMLERTDEARRHAALHREIMEDLGEPVLYAAAGEIRGRTELLLGDAEAAEREFRDSYESLQRIGERGYAVQIAALLAWVLCVRGAYVEARQLVQENAAHAGPDRVAQIDWHRVRAKLEACNGSMDEAERLAREGVALAADSDLLIAHGDARVDLAQVLQTLGQTENAASELAQALSLYERKGSLAAARRVRESIASLT